MLALNNLGLLYDALGRYAEAEALLKRAVAILEKSQRPDHPPLWTSLNNLAVVYASQGLHSKAEPLYKRSLAISESALGAEHPNVGTATNNLAELYRSLGRYGEAESLYKRALAVFREGARARTSERRSALSNLATLSFVQRDWIGAVAMWRRSASIITRRSSRVANAFNDGNSKSEAERSSGQFLGLVKAMYRLAAEKHAAVDAAAREMFQSAQWAQGSQAATSIAQMAARGAKGDPRLAGLVRERQDLVAEWIRRDGARTAAVSQVSNERDQAVEAANVARLTVIDARITAIDSRLAAEFPDYAALTRPTPLSVDGGAGTARR